jgi:molybdate transport system substrate-binding protein
MAREGTGTDIGVGTISQIIATKGLRLIGPLPAELQSHIVYAAAPMAKAQSPHGASAFISYLASPSAKATLAATGIE